MLCPVMIYKEENIFSRQLNGQSTLDLLNYYSYLLSTNPVYQTNLKSFDFSTIKLDRHNIQKSDRIPIRDVL